MAARINLSRDLPKVRQHYAKVILAQSTNACDYTAPCVIGAMVNPAKRRWLQDAEGRGDAPDTEISMLLREGLLVAPSEQHGDLIALQRKFDNGDKAAFERKLQELESKYLPQVSA